jgi:hypothetical protein
VKEVLAKLTMACTGTPWDTIWHFVLTIDPKEQEKAHAKMIIQFARYARQSIEEVEAMELTEVQRYYRELVDVVQGENAFTMAAER